MKKNKVYLVGAGPGDYGLITLKGLQTIEIADVLVYDRLINENLIYRAPAHCEKITLKTGGESQLGPGSDHELLYQKPRRQNRGAP